MEITFNYSGVDTIDEIILQYIIKDKEIKIFGTNFVNNNKNNCKMIIEGNEMELKDKINNITNNILEIKLKGIKNITNMSYMFAYCSSLNSLSDISKWNTSNVNNMSYMFSSCSSLNSLPDISKWNTSNVNNMSGMFYNCSSLNSLPDISKWNTSKAKNDMSYMFDGCSKLSKIPKFNN